MNFDTDWAALGLDYGLGKNAFDMCQREVTISVEEAKLDAHRLHCKMQWRKKAAAAKKAKVKP